MTNPPEFQVSAGGAIAIQQPIAVAGKSPAHLFWERLRQDKAGHCDVEEPPLEMVEEGHEAACHYPLERWPMSDAEIRQAEGAEREDRPHLEGASHSV
jgi:hypothetical protein